ncbi:hypothetical protein NECAME_09408 [Necator americanus]|uniref:Uncharacterized protein n=1 Tax=Necator americanus TaxID=51031 RepID=W2TE15_NECAM|nr:hypothetical protein NECAME_09408 [Necator americanus]ETN80088.1 hypothetical protein NECAME_09408 [Necator americanus]
MRELHRNQCACKSETNLLLRDLTGTNVDEARRILKESGLPIISADDLADAAEKAVSALNVNSKKM